MVIRLDSRLSAAAALVLPDKPMADIGSDHGLLPAFLLQQGICPKVISADLSQPSCDKASALCRAEHLEDGMEVRQGNGLTVLSPGEADSIVICGMGGYLTIEILENSPDVLAHCQRLILQPQKDVPAVREWLQDHGWQIVDERMAFAHDFYYVIMAAEKGSMSLSPEELEFGPCILKNKPELFFDWLRFRISGIDQILSSLSQIRTADAEKRCTALTEERKKLEALLSL